MEENKSLLHTTALMNLTHIMLSETIRFKKIYYLICMKFKIGKINL